MIECELRVSILFKKLHITESLRVTDSDLIALDGSSGQNGGIIWMLPLSGICGIDGYTGPSVPSRKCESRTKYIDKKTNKLDKKQWKRYR